MSLSISKKKKKCSFKFKYFFLRIPVQLYEKVCEETMENLCETIEHVLEEKFPSEFDVSL